MSGVRGKVAVVTGATSGIGGQLAFELARRGLASPSRTSTTSAWPRPRTTSRRREPTCTPRTSTSATAPPSRPTPRPWRSISAWCSRFTTTRASAAAAARCSTTTGRPTTASSGSTSSASSTAPRRSCRLIASGDGHVVNVSSLNGIMAQGALSDYCTAKFGVRGFTESQRGEMLLARRAVQIPAGSRRDERNGRRPNAVSGSPRRPPATASARSRPTPRAGTPRRRPAPRP